MFPSWLCTFMFLFFNGCASIHVAGLLYFFSPFFFFFFVLSLVYNLHPVLSFCFFCFLIYNPYGRSLE